MVRVVPGLAPRWDAPRGPRATDATWTWALEDRPLVADMSEVERHAVATYRGLMMVVRREMAARQMSVRDVARSSGRSLGVTSDALTGSCWPRWSTLEALASAVDHWLVTAVDKPLRDPVLEVLFWVKDDIEAGKRSPESIGAEVGLGPRTVLDILTLTDVDRPLRLQHDPSSASMLALVAFASDAVQIEPK